MIKDSSKMIIILHTSKSMRTVSSEEQTSRPPKLIDKACELVDYMRTMTSKQIADTMHVSAALADDVVGKYAAWNDEPSYQSSAIDSFVGDIYSGLRASTLSDADREYADKHLRILSGLYGVLRPFDGILPYRLEMGYRLPAKQYRNLYTFWSDGVARTLPSTGMVVNLAAVEYSRLVTPFIDISRIITPRFLTINEKTHEPVFVVVHAKIARGAFARWMVTSRIDSAERLHEFSDIGYHFDAMLSTPTEPVFICSEFGGKGLSMRLEQK